MTQRKAKPLQPATNIIHTKITQEADRYENLKSGRSLQGGLQNRVSQPKDLKALKASTNIIHNKTQRKAPRGLKKLDENSDAVKLPEKNETESKSTPAKSKIKVDENDVDAYFKGSYNPLDDYYPLDEELYQRVCKLELADDGLPKFDSDEPFDFST